MAYHHGDLRATLLEEAEKLLDQHGAEKLTLRDIARSAGVSHGAPAHHFGNKQGLLTALAIIVIGRLGDYLRKTLRETASSDPREQLAAIFMAYLKFASHHPEQFLLHTSATLLDYSDFTLRKARADLGGILDEILGDACETGWLEPKDLLAARFASMAMVRGYAGVITGGLPHYTADNPEDGADILKRGATAAIELFANSLLRPPKGYRKR